MTSSAVQTTDVVNAILGIDESSYIAQLRNQKPTLITELQDYYDALFIPNEDSAAALSLADRLVVAVRVASFTESEDVVDWYTERALEAGVSEEVLNRAEDIATTWDGETSLDAAIRHADLLTTHPVDARKSHLDDLKAAGLTPAAIVSLSQTVAFVSYQLRLIAGLRAFGDQA